MAHLSGSNRLLAACSFVGLVHKLLPAAGALVTMLLFWLLYDLHLVIASVEGYCPKSLDQERKQSANIGFFRVARDRLDKTTRDKPSPVVPGGRWNSWREEKVESIAEFECFLRVSCRV